MLALLMSSINADLISPANAVKLSPVIARLTGSIIPLLMGIGDSGLHNKYNTIYFSPDVAGGPCIIVKVYEQSILLILSKIIFS